MLCTPGRLVSSSCRARLSRQAGAAAGLFLQPDRIVGPAKPPHRITQTGELLRRRRSLDQRFENMPGP